MSKVIVIAAVAANNVIGNGMKIPWYLSEDFKRFKNLTMGHTVVMGQRTWESLPVRPLPGRRNVVLCDKPYEAEGAEVFGSMENALSACADDGKVFLIGGASVYAAGCKLADTLEITRLWREYDGDVFFPEIDADVWEETARINRSDPKFGDYSFMTFRRRNPPA